MNRTALHHTALRRLLCVCAWLVVCALVAPRGVAAQTLDLGGVWYEAKSPTAANAVPSPRDLTQVGELSRTGGRYWYVADFEVVRPGTYVLDFRNTSTIARFRHLVFDGRGKLVAQLHGGISDRTPNPFFLRHGREVPLAAGRYRLWTELDSPFLLGQPEPFAMPLAQYQTALKVPSALVMFGLGVFAALGLYYAVLAIVRRRVADAMYALFILGNFLYNGTALLVFSDLFGLHWFYLVSAPILFSNIAYLAFVLSLLEIRYDTHRALYGAGLLLIALFASFIVVAAIVPSWSLELDRVGVGLFATYGLAAASFRALEGNSSARWYLVAVGAFFVLGMASITLSRMDAYTLSIEHVGLSAVALEVVLLAFVIAQQFARLEGEKERALHRANQSIRIAYTDALTGLPNRYQLEQDLGSLPAHGSLTFIDLDGLKHYNDTYGHKRGDELLCGFARHLRERIAGRAALFRLGGDEFAITCASGDLAFVAGTVDAAIFALRRDGFEFAGASFGSVHVHEAPSQASLKHMADTRMYEQKGQRRSMASI